jgi:hypothetical protein
MLALVLAFAAVAGLAVGAVHGARQSSTLASAADARAWQTDEDYWACLDAQAHSLAAPGERVWLDTHNLSDWVTLEKVFGPWADVVNERGQAGVRVSLRPAKGRDQCLGTVLVGTGPHGAGGRAIVRVGTGGSLRGHRPLPTTPE